MITFYKGTGSLALYPSTDRKSSSYRKLMMSFAKSTGEKASGGRGTLVDRENTIIVGFEYIDMCRLRMWIFNALRDPSKVTQASFHRDLGEEKRLLNVTVGKVDSNGNMTYGLMVSSSRGETKNSIAVYLSTDELYALMMFVERAISVCLDTEFTPYTGNEGENE